MKKVTLVLIFISLATLISYSQSYIRVNAGYALPLNSDLIGEETNTTYNPNTGEESGTVKGIYGSYGSGISFHAAYGNTFGGGSIGYDLEAGYLIGKEYSVKSTYTYLGAPPDESTEKSSARSFQFSPSLFLTASAGKIQPYTRMGPVLAFSKSDIEYHSDFIDATVELTGGFNIGLKGALGINFSPDKKIRFFTEVNFVSMAYTPKEGEITRLIVDGVDQLDGLTDDETKITFEKEYKFSDSSTDNIQTRESYSMGSAGIQFGVKFML